MEMENNSYILLTILTASINDSARKILNLYLGKYQKIEKEKSKTKRKIIE